MIGALIEATHVTLGGEVGNNDWAFPYLDEQFAQYTTALLTRADALLLGRLTYQHLSIAYTRMAEADEAPAGVPSDFIGRMNSIPKLVASTTLSELTWNATAIDVASFVDDLKRNAGQNLLRFGNGALDATLMEHGLIDEFHLFLTPVAIGKGKHLFESIDTAPHLRLVDVRRLDSGVLILVYTPK